MTNLRKFFRKGEAGFTLVELLVVIVILGILAGIGVQQFTGVREQAQTTAHNANVRILHGAAQMAYFVNQDLEGDNLTSGSVIGNFVDTWPDNPLGTGDYTVTIGSNGKITVSPGAVSN